MERLKLLGVAVQSSRKFLNRFVSNTEGKRSNPQRGKFDVEPFESRLLLSADLVPILPDAASSPQPAPIKMDAADAVGAVDAVDLGPSTIVWDNRGDSSDGFDDVFGAGVAANRARTVVDAAIDFWERIITDFHYSDGSHDMHVTISIDPSETGFGGGASIDSILDGKVKAGTISLDSGNDTSGDGNGDGAGWFIDPTPYDWSEFNGNLVNAFAGDAPGGSPANGLADLFTVVAAELTHVMGINSNTGVRLHTGGFETDTGIADDAEGGGVGNFWIFNGPSIDHLMTSNNGGSGGSDKGRIVHTAGPRANNSPIVFSGLTLFGSQDAGNAVYEGSRRYLPSNVDALILKDVYDFDIVMPETFGTFYSVLNETTGQLVVRGGTDNTVIDGVNQGADSDFITVVRNGDSIVVSVDVQHDVVGTGTGKTANDAQNALVSVFDVGSVTSLLIQARGGNDTVIVDSALNIPVTIEGGDGDDFLQGGDVTINGGAGNDVIYGSDGVDNLSGDTGNDTIFGLGGNDVISGGDGDDLIYAGSGINTVSDGLGNDLIDLSENSVAVTYSTSGGNDNVIGTAFNDTITGSTGNDRLEGRGGNDLLIGAAGTDALFGGDGSDTFVWNPGDGSDLIEGGDGNDVMTFNGSGAAEVFTLSAVGTRLQLLRNLGGINMDVAGIEQVNLNALAGADSTTINDLTTTDVQVVNVDNGAGDSAADSLVVNGRAVDDNLTASVAAGVVTVTGLGYDVRVSSSTTDDQLTVKGNDGDDTIKAVPPVESVIAIVLDGGNGNDYLSADATLIGGSGNDTLVGGSGNDTMIGGDGDDVFLLTAGNGGGTDTVDGGNGGDTILVRGGNANDSITLSVATGDLIATIGGVSTTYLLAASNFEQVIADGGGQNTAEGDRVNIVATAGDDSIAINGAAITVGGVTFSSVGVEDLRLNSGAGTDTLTYTGLFGVAEQINVAGSPTANSGKIDVSGVLTLSFTDAEHIVVHGNATDSDELTFFGTNDPDQFEINLVAAGTAADPVLKLQAGDTVLLTLDNYTGLQTLNVSGLDGEDVFNVYTSETGPSRNLFVNGGLPNGKKKSTDKLNVFYTSPRPHIIHSTATQDPDAGLVDLDYDTARFLIQYDEMELVVISKL